MRAKVQPIWTIANWNPLRHSLGFAPRFLRDWSRVATSCATALSALHGSRARAEGVSNRSDNRAWKWDRYPVYQPEAWADSTGDPFKKRGICMRTSRPHRMKLGHLLPWQGARIPGSKILARRTPFFLDVDILSPAADRRAELPQHCKGSCRSETQTFQSWFSANNQGQHAQGLQSRPRYCAVR
jgi:hypothetical protein